MLREKLSSREFEKIASVLDLQRLLKLFWVVRIVWSELQGRSGDDFAFYTLNNENILHAVSQKVKEDLKDVEDLKAVMVDILAYRDILFRSSNYPGVQSSEKLKAPSEVVVMMGTEAPDSFKSDKVHDHDAVEINTRNLSKTIQVLFSPLLSLDQRDLTLLLHIDTPSIRKDELSRLKYLSSEQAEELDSVELLRMVCVVIIAGDRLRQLPKSSFEYFANNENIKHSVPFSVFTCLEMTWELS